MPDMLIACVQCGTNFPWPEEDQEFYAKMNFTKPRRCPHCRPDRSSQRVKNGLVEPRPAPARNPIQRSLNSDPIRGPLINQDGIVEFVRKVEDKKGYRRDVRLVFAHIVEEIGELAAKIYRYESEAEASASGAADPDPIGKELLDIIFLACYLADILNMDLNEIIPERMAEIRAQYGVAK